MARYKLFFVSAQRKLWACSVVHTDKHIMDVTVDDLFAHYKKKSCQEGCGVYCAVSASLLVEKPIAVLGKEIVARAKRVPSVLRAPSRPRVDDQRPRSPGDPDRAHEMDGSANGSPAADNRVALRERA